MNRVALGQVVDFTNGGTPSRSKPEFWGGSMPWITGADIAEDGSISARSFISEAAVKASSTNVLPAGTVLLLTRTSVGKVGVLPEPMAINQDITAITPSNRLDTRYLVQFLRSSKSKLLKNLRGATIKGVTRDDVASLELALPPLPEQRRIAAILDHAHALRAKRRQILTHLDGLIQSIFHDMFGDVRSNQHGYDVATIDGISERVTDGEHKTPRRSESGFPLLSARNVRDGWIDFENTDFVDADEYAFLSRRIEPREGDVLISCSGTIGRVAQVRERNRFAMVRSAALVRPGPAVHPTFLERTLASPTLKSIMVAQANSSAQANLFQNQIKRLPVIVPPIALQQEFAERVARVGAVVDVAQQTTAAEDELFASLQILCFPRGAVTDAR